MSIQQFFNYIMARTG